MSQTTIDARQSKNIRSPERNDVLKYEILEGRIVPKPAANRWHNLIATNFAIAIGGRVNRGACEVYISDMQVRMGRNSICFPDVVVVSGEPVFTDNSSEMLQNPTVVIDI